MSGIRKSITTEMNMQKTDRIESPCVRRCTLNDDDICVGCGRTLEEIKQWSLAEPETQRKISESAQQRIKLLQVF